MEQEGQVLRFNLFDDSSFTYVVTVPTTEGRHIFTGVIRNADREERTVTGHTQFRVGPPPTPAPMPEPAATPTPTATVAVAGPEAGDGPPGILWVIPVIVVVGVILAVFFYLRTRR